MKKGKARAISVNEGAINPMAPAGFQRFYYQGQEFEVAEPEWPETYKVHAEAAAENHAQVIEAGGLFILAPSATSPAASTTSSAAAPAARATPANRASISRLKTTSCASSPSSG